MDETKFCPRCQRDLPVAGFALNRARYDGLAGYCRTCDREVGAASARTIRLRALEALGGRCARCGFDDARALQIDHVLGNGGEHRRVVSSSTLFRRIARGEQMDGEFQVLCANCNIIKRVEEAEHVGSRVYQRAPGGPDRPRAARKRWARRHDRCVECGRDEQPHHSHGLCATCWMREHRRRQRDQ